jgi:hypothetical protein
MAVDMDGFLVIVNRLHQKQNFKIEAKRGRELALCPGHRVIKHAALLSQFLLFCLRLPIVSVSIMQKPDAFYPKWWGYWVK